MSNGDDVLDNWEEIDEVELTNKLEKLEERKIKAETQSEKIKKICFNICEEDKSTTTISNSTPGTMKLLQRAAQTKKLPNSVVAAQQQSSEAINPSLDVQSPLDNMKSTFQPVLMVLHKDSDEYQSANYAQPINTQTVKILRRPTQSTEPRNNDQRPRQPIKTLQQREQEYAEARLRILGSAKNPEDDAAAAVNTSPSTTSSFNATTIATNNTTITTTNTNNMQTKTNSSPKLQQQSQLPSQLQLQQQQQQQLLIQQQQQQFGTAKNLYNYYYQQQQQNIYYQKQQQQQQQQPQLQHSLSSPAFVNNRISYSTTAGLLPTPPIAPISAVNIQHRHQYQQLQQYQQQPQQQVQSQPQTWSPVVGGSVSSYTLQRQQQRQQQLQQQQQPQQLDILRTPRGPDGSTGFQMRR